MQQLQNLLSQVGERVEPFAKWAIGRQNGIQITAFSLQNIEQGYISSTHVSHSKIVGQLYLVDLQMKRVIRELSSSMKVEEKKSIRPFIHFNIDGFLTTLKCAKEGLYYFAQNVDDERERKELIAQATMVGERAEELAALKCYFPTNVLHSLVSANLPLVESLGIACIEPPIQTKMGWVEALSSSLNFVTTVVIDPNPEWKRRRYENYLKAFKELLPPSNCFPVDFSIEENKDASNSYKAIQTILRTGLLASSNVNILHHFAQAWFTNVVHLPFIEQLVFDLAQEVRGEPFSSDWDQKNLFSSKMRQVWFALRHISPQAESLTLVAKKMIKITANFDPLADMNMPWQTHQTVFSKGEQKKRTIHFRTAVPIGPRRRRDISCLPWEEGYVAIVPEYIGMLQAMQENQQKLLVIVHLDPKHYDSIKGEVVSTSYWDYLDPLKFAEAFWIRLLKQTADHFEDTMEIALLPIDGEWFKDHVCSYEYSSREDFRNILLATMGREEGPFLFPKSCGRGEELRRFLLQVIEEVDEQYFSELHLLGRSQKLAFVGLLHGRLAEHIQLRCDVDYVQHNCTDGADRTMALLMSEWMDKMWRLHLFDDPTLQQQIIGAGNGVAMAVWKRAMLEERAEIAFSVVDHLETLLSNHPRINPSHGFELLDFHLAAKLNQTLKKAPAFAQSSDEYRKLLALEIRSPHLHPQRLSEVDFLDHLQRETNLSTEVALDQQLLKDMRRQTVFIEEERFNCAEYHDDELVAELEKRLASSSIKDQSLVHKIKLCLTQSFFFSVFNLCRDHYANEAQSFEVVSGTDLQGRIYGLYRRGESWILKGSAQFDIIDIATAKIIAKLLASTELDLSREEMAAYLGWRVEEALSSS